jgi:hypothetical protein
MPRRSAALPALLVLAAASVVTPALPGRAGAQAAGSRGAGAWLPLAAGAEWLYRTHRDHQFTPDGGAAERQFYLGRSSQRILQRRGTQAAPQYHLEEVLTERHTQGGPVRSNRVLEWWSVGSQGTRLHERREEGLGDVVIGQNVFDPPLVYVTPQAGPGAGWSVGVARAGTLEVPLAATASAFEDVSIGGLVHESCLKVLYQGPVRGNLEQVDGGRIEVKEGRVERLVWWKAGVGIVQDVTRLEAQVRLPGERGGRIVEVFSKRLERHLADR